MKKLIYVTDEYSRGFYDGDTKELIRFQGHSDDLTWVLRDLANKGYFSLEERVNHLEEMPDKLC